MKTAINRSLYSIVLALAIILIAPAVMVYGHKKVF